jgi:hypothetical protein
LRTALAHGSRRSAVAPRRRARHHFILARCHAHRVDFAFPFAHRHAVLCGGGTLRGGVRCFQRGFAHRSRGLRTRRRYQDRTRPRLRSFCSARPGLPLPLDDLRPQVPGRHHRRWRGATAVAFFPVAVLRPAWLLPPAAPVARLRHGAYQRRRPVAPFAAARPLRPAALLARPDPPAGRRLRHGAYQRRRGAVPPLAAADARLRRRAALRLAPRPPGPPRHRRSEDPRRGPAPAAPRRSADPRRNPASRRAPLPADPRRERPPVTPLRPGRSEGILRPVEPRAVRGVWLRRSRASLRAHLRQRQPGGWARCRRTFGAWYTTAPPAVRPPAISMPGRPKKCPIPIARALRAPPPIAARLPRVFGSAGVCGASPVASPVSIRCILSR